MSFLSQTTSTSSSSLTGSPEVDAILQDLPRINALGTIKTVVDGLSEFDSDELSNGPATARALMGFSFLAHSYIWSDPDGGSEIPKKIAAPWVSLADRCGLPPVLTYSSYVLDNQDGSGAQDPAPLLSFTGGVDEFWFIRVHQRIELAGGAVRTLADPDAPFRFTPSGLVAKLTTIANALEAMCDAARRMEEGCDPYIYYHRLRRFLFGWKWNPVFGDRAMRYEGIRTVDLPLGGQYSGESGSQSPLLPLIDQLLGIDHQEPFRRYAVAMREYMYPDHRLLIAKAPNLYIDLRSNGSAEAAKEYKRALEGLIDFRSVHLEFAKRYIVGQASNDGSANDIGTGGSAALSVLASARATVEERLRDPAI